MLIFSDDVEATFNGPAPGPVELFESAANCHARASLKFNKLPHEHAPPYDRDDKFVGIPADLVDRRLWSDGPCNRFDCRPKICRFGHSGRWIGPLSRAKGGNYLQMCYRSTDKIQLIWPEPAVSQSLLSRSEQ